MEKLKIYLDTSVISYLSQPERGEKYINTLYLWKLFRSNEFNICISTQVLYEIKKNDLLRQFALLNYLNEINYSILLSNKNILSIVEKILNESILKLKSLDDCIHISFAITNNCDYILSWNFRHFVKEKTKKGVERICKDLDLKPSIIISPNEFIDYYNRGKLYD